MGRIRLIALGAAAASVFLVGVTTAATRHLTGSSITAVRVAPVAGFFTDSSEPVKVPGAEVFIRASSELGGFLLIRFSGVGSCSKERQFQGFPATCDVRLLVKGRGRETVFWGPVLSDQSERRRGYYPTTGSFSVETTFARLAPDQVYSVEAQVAAFGGAFFSLGPATLVVERVRAD
jgi:hypothetical protein